MIFNQPIWLPKNHFYWQSNSSSSGALMDASGEKVGMIFKAVKNVTLHKVHFTTGTITAGGASMALRVSFQRVNSSGNPDGVQEAYRDLTLTSADDNVAVSTGILSSDGTDNGTKFSVTPGNLFAVVIEYSSFTAGDSFRWSYFNRILSEINESDCYAWNSVTGKVAEAAFIIPEDSNGNLFYSATPAPFITLQAETGLTSASNPVRKGFKFQSPFAFKMQGLILPVVPNASQCLVTLGMYQSDGKTLIQTADQVWDSTMRQQTGAMLYKWTFSGGYWIQANTTYYFYISNSTANGVSLRYGTLMNATFHSVLHPFTICHFASQHSTNDPSETDTKFIFPMFEITEIPEPYGRVEFNRGFN